MPLDEELPLLVATLRGGYGRHVGEPAWEDFIARLLAASDDFARLWQSGDVAPPGSRIKVVRHASVGEIRLTSTSMRVSGVPETRIVVYTPCDDESRDHVRRVRLLHDPLIGCTMHAKPLSVLREERAAAETRAGSGAESSDPASL